MKLNLKKVTKNYQNKMKSSVAHVRSKKKNPGLKNATRNEAQHNNIEAIKSTDWISLNY